MTERYYQPELEGFPELDSETKRRLAGYALSDTVEFPVITDEMLCDDTEDHIYRGEN